MTITKIERFAQLRFGIDLTDRQIQMIKAMIEKSYSISFSRYEGKSKARDVYQAWCKSCLEEEGAI